MKVGTSESHLSESTIIDVIQTRRSVQDGYINKTVSREDIEVILNCGIAAPSSKNAQPWRIHVLESGERLDRIATAVHCAKNGGSYAPINPESGELRQWGSSVAKSAQILGSVGVGFFIENTAAFSGGRSAVTNAHDDVRENGIVGYSFEMIGIGALIENMWLGAHAQGLGAVFMGDVLVAEKEIQSELGFSGDLVGVVAVGHSINLPSDKVISPDKVVYHSSV